MTRYLFLMIVLLALSGCGEDGPGTDGPTTTVAATTTDTTAATPTETTTGPAEGECSTSGLRVNLETQEGLPAEVASMRENIFAAALACDFDRLQELALAGAPQFSYSFGESETAGQPARFWRDAEARGEAVLAELVRVLNLPGATVGTGADQLYVWPFAYALDWQDLTEEDRGQLAEHFGPEEIRGWEEIGGYLDYRAGIRPDGDWLFFVAGD